jgi:hypothetical protein
VSEQIAVGLGVDHLVSSVFHVEYGVMPSRVWQQWSWSCSLRLVVALLLQLAALRWSEPEATGGKDSTPLPIKLACCSLDLGGEAWIPPLLEHRGGGDEEERLGQAAIGGSTERCPRAVVHLRVHISLDPWSVSGGRCFWKAK